MIHFDVTKAAGARHRSGLTRVSARLLDHLGAAARPIRWDPRRRGFADGVSPEPADWFLTAELFSEEERPGFSAFLASRSCRTAAIFHDAIPLRLPHVTWPQSVARHPAYLKLLARCDRVWAVSAASRDELLGIWRWQELPRVPPVEVLPLGSDVGSLRRTTVPSPHRPARLLCLGIIEPRKNQGFLAEVCAALWDEGVDFELHVIGRVNPHFGPPLLARLQEVRRRHPTHLFLHGAADDATVAALLATARATVFPSLAEGCGLPLLESLWQGVPCVGSDLPALRENAAAGGCVLVAPDDAAAWRDAIRRVVTDDPFQAALVRSAATRPLPTWQDAAQVLLAGLH
ncbi:MAG: glycosyltransferase [Verrucomicrobia bacterium]|nr:glycosyltransferase [Verrucomicrobiota bacterium]